MMPLAYCIGQARRVMSSALVMIILILPVLVFAICSSTLFAYHPWASHYPSTYLKILCYFFSTISKACSDTSGLQNLHTTFALLQLCFCSVHLLPVSWAWYWSFVSGIFHGPELILMTSCHLQVFAQISPFTEAFLGKPIYKFQPEVWSFKDGSYLLTFKLLFNNLPFSVTWIKWLMLRHFFFFFLFILWVWMFASIFVCIPHVYAWFLFTDQKRMTDPP